jgi:hypothetical protein
MNEAKSPLPISKTPSAFINTHNETLSVVAMCLVIR